MQRRKKLISAINIGMALSYIGIVVAILSIIVIFKFNYVALGGYMVGAGAFMTIAGMWIWAYAESNSKRTQCITNGIPTE